MNTDAEMPIELIFEVLDRPISIYPCFIRMTGSLKSAFFLSVTHELTLTLAPDVDGWFQFSTNDWVQLGLSIAEQKAIKRHLQELGVLLSKRVGMPSIGLYKLDYPRLYELLREQASSNFGKAVRLAYGDTAK